MPDRPEGMEWPPEPAQNAPKVGSESSDRLGATLAFYATRHPAPGQSYSGISTPAGIVYLRVITVDGLCEATEKEQENEVLLNTVESEDL